MCGVVFTDAQAAQLAYYGMYHVLFYMTLTPAQVATAAGVMAAAREVCTSAGVLLYDLPVSVRDMLMSTDVQKIER